MYRSKLNEKLQESLAAVLPILAIVLILSFTIAPLPTSVLMAFLFGAVLLVVGMMFFSLGAELAMSPMGERVGACITKTRRVGIMLTLGFLLGFLITISEPDLQVLANQVQAVPNMVLIVTVAVGVGLFLCFDIVVFGLAMFVPEDFLAVAFDSGGVTTGPMTVPFIMAMGVGVSAIRSDKHSANDSFGLVALCSIGPILAVLILSLIFRPDGGSYTPVVIPEIGDSAALCGGCHTSATGNIGYFQITSESAIAAGIRRIEAVTGVEAERYSEAAQEALRSARAFFNNVPDLAGAIQKLINENSVYKKQVESFARKQAAELAAELGKIAVEQNGINLIAIDHIPGDSSNPDMLRDAALLLQKELHNTALVAAIDNAGKPQLMLMYSADLVEAGKNAGKDIREAAKAIQGGGGGQNALATAGGRNLEGLSEAFAILKACATRN